MCCLRNIALESVTDGQPDGQADRQTDGQTTDKVIPMCRYASQAKKKNTTCKYQKKQGGSMAVGVSTVHVIGSEQCHLSDFYMTCNVVYAPF